MSNLRRGIEYLDYLEGKTPEPLEEREAWARIKGHLDNNGAYIYGFFTSLIKRELGQECLEEKLGELLEGLEEERKDD